MPRLFTALEVPPEVARALAALRGGLPGARWIDPESYHLTLRFIGDVDDAQAGDIHTTLEGIRRAPVTVTLSGLTVFGGDKPRMIVMAAKPDAALVALHGEQEQLMRRIGLAPETRRFTPHVTLARLRGVTSFIVADYLADQELLTIQPFLARRFILLSARDSIGGGPYITQSVYDLA